MKNIEKQNGITLIDLIVTIIVLLILAGVTIKTLIGTNGILTQTINAKNTNEIVKIKEEWDTEKLGLKLQGEKIEEINASGEDLKKYIKDIPNSLINKVSIVRGELAYDINKCSDKEKLMFKSDYSFKATGDTVAPYGSVEKKLKDGKVEITVFSADDESDIDEIILPDGTIKKIKYETENILLKGKLISNEAIHSIESSFKNVVLDEENKINDVTDASKYNVIIDLNSYLEPINYDFLNNCFENGKNILSSGNDSKSKLMIIKQNWHETGKYNIKKIKENEVTKFYNKTTGEDAFLRIKFNDDVNVWATATINENTTDALGEYVSENGNRWIHEHLVENDVEENFFRNAVYHIAESRCAKYEVTQNGTYMFKIRDLAGNETEISTDVTEL